WMERKYPLSPFIINGTSEWQHLILRTDVTPYFAPMLGVRAELSDELKEAAKELRLAPHEFFPVHTDRGVLFLMFQPSEVNVPGSPPELGRHYMAWLAASLELFSKN